MVILIFVNVRRKALKNADVCKLITLKKKGLFYKQKVLIRIRGG